MLEVTIVQTLDCSKERFWELFFDPTFTHTMLTEGLGFGSCEIGPVQQRGNERHREMRVVPKLELPAPVAKVLGERLGYREEGVFAEDTQTWSYKIHLNTLGDRIRLGGRFHIEPKGEQQCTRHSVLWVEAKMLGLGGLIEKSAEKNMRDGWDRAAKWMNAQFARPGGADSLPR